MNFLRFKDIEAYSLPELFADLGGCLGLYIGASLISIIEFQELLLHIIALFYSKLNHSFYIGESGFKNSSKMARSRSIDGFIAVSNKPYSINSRPEGPTPPVFYIRTKKRTRNIGTALKVSDVGSMTDEEKYSSKICNKCLSDIQNLQNGYMYHRKHPKLLESV